MRAKTISQNPLTAEQAYMQLWEATMDRSAGAKAYAHNKEAAIRELQDAESRLIGKADRVFKTIGAKYLAAHKSDTGFDAQGFSMSLSSAYPHKASRMTDPLHRIIVEFSNDPILAPVTEALGKRLNDAGLNAPYGKGGRNLICCNYPGEGPLPSDVSRPELETVFDGILAELEPQAQSGIHIKNRKKSGSRRSH